MEKMEIFVCDLKFLALSTKVQLIEKDAKKANKGFSGSVKGNRVCKYQTID